MTPSEFLAHKLALGLTWDKLAPLLGRSPSQLRKWAAGDWPIPHWVPNELARIRAEAGKLREAERREEELDAEHGSWRQVK